MYPPISTLMYRRARSGPAYAQTTLRVGDACDASCDQRQVCKVGIERLWKVAIRATAQGGRLIAKDIEAAVDADSLDCVWNCVEEGEV
jgi:hypothetical protein